MLKPQPYKLKNTIQHYEWGMKGKNAFIPKLLNIKAEKDKSYAELWMGAHLKASSKIKIDDKIIDLAEAIRNYPIEMLGKKTAKVYSNSLPFLFKVLSASEALSIQVHPNKRQAISLHKKDPINYPDSNQKLEIAIALDSLTALVGFKSAKQVVKTLNEYPEIGQFVGGSIKHIKNVIRSLIKKSITDKEKLVPTIAKLECRIAAKKKHNEIEKYFLKLHKKYNTEVGLLLLFFLNLIHLKKGEAIFTKPGVPHAYLKGNILECMSNSDNVIRAGLTPKYKDIDSLLKVLTYELNLPKIIKGKKRENSLVYRTDAKEFQFNFYILKKEELKFTNQRGPRVLLALKGEIIIDYLDKRKLESVMISKGESVFLPASLTNYSIGSPKSSQFVLVSVPLK